MSQNASHIHPGTNPSTPLRHPGLRVAIFILAVITTLPFQATAGRHHFGLVLSGGGARGLAQIGILKALEENGMRPDFIVATSMGAIVGSLYSCGYPADSIETFAKTVNWNEIFSNKANRNQLLVSQKNEPVAHLLELRVDNILRPSLPRSVSYGQPFHDYLVSRITPAQYHARSFFDSLPIPLRIITTDIITGDMVVYSRGNLISVIRASCSAPLAFSPVPLDSMLLMDGGLSANIPVEVAISQECDYILAADVTSPMWSRHDINNPIRLVDQIIAIGIRRQKTAERQLAHRMVIPDLHGNLNTDFSQIDSLVAWGYQAAMEQMPQIRMDLASRTPATAQSMPASSFPIPQAHFSCTDLLVQRTADSLAGALSAKGRPADMHTLAADLRQRFSLPYLTIGNPAPGDTSSRKIINPGHLRDIHIRGNATTSSRMLVRASGLVPGSVLKPGTLSEAVTSLYATGLFNTVNAELDSTGTAILHVEEKELFRLRVGARFDEFHLGEGFIEPAFENLFGLGILSQLHLQYGLRREKYALELQGNHLVTSRWVNTFQLKGYIAREQIVSRTETPDTTDSTGARIHILYNETSLRKAGFLALMGTQIGKLVMFNGGIKIERFTTFSSDGSVFEKLPGSFMQGIQYLVANITMDDLDRFVFPTRGQQHHLTIGAARDAFGGTESFLKIDGSFKGITTFGGRHTVTPQAQFGWASHKLPDIERFFLGGALSEERYSEMSVYNYLPFMGMRPRALPGDIMMVLRLSYRYTPVRDLYFIAGLDWGETWDFGKLDPENLDAGKILTNAPLGLGIGVAYNSPIGPLRFSWGQLLNKAHNHPQVRQEHVFYFSAGRDF